MRLRLLAILAALALVVGGVTVQASATSDAPRPASNTSALPHDVGGCEECGSL